MKKFHDGSWTAGLNGLLMLLISFLITVLFHRAAAVTDAAETMQFQHWSPVFFIVTGSCFVLMIPDWRRKEVVPVIVTAATVAVLFFRRIAGGGMDRYALTAALMAGGIMYLIATLFFGEATSE